MKFKSEFYHFHKTNCIWNCRLPRGRPFCPGGDELNVKGAHIRARFLSLARSKLRLCSANHRAGYFSNLACDWLSIVWAYSEQETENGPRIIIWQMVSEVESHSAKSKLDLLRVFKLNSYIVDNIDSCIGLLPYRTRPLPEPMLINHQ